MYLTRIMLAVICTTCEVYLHEGVHHAFGSFAAKISLVIHVISIGMTTAAVSFLPSSFSMYAVIVIMASHVLSTSSSLHLKISIFAHVVNLLVGWPFAAIAGVPFAVATALQNKNRILFMVKWSFIALISVGTPLVLVDSYYYGRPVFAPLNIVMYNVFGSSGGPDLYGTEPTSYYVMNLFLNFNLIQRYCTSKINHHGFARVFVI